MLAKWHRGGHTEVLVHAVSPMGGPMGGPIGGPVGRPVSEVVSGVVIESPKQMSQTKDPMMPQVKDPSRMF